MTISGGLNCKKHGGYIGECKDCVIDQLKEDLNRQASSHGLYITQTLEPKIWELERERDELKELITTWQKTWDNFTPMNAAKNAEIEKFRKALEFYADKENWDLHEMTPTIWDDGAVDCGHRARIALDITDEIDTIRWPNDAGN